MLDPPDFRADDHVLDQRSRAGLFQALSELRRPATTAQLAKVVGLHQNGVRAHLMELERAGLLVRTRRTGGRGRPPDLWEVAVGARPGGVASSAYRELAGFLARAIGVSSASPESMRAAGRDIGRELAGQWVSSGEGVESALVEMGFAPYRGRAGRGRVILRLGNCPYREAVQENPVAICALHEGMCEGLIPTLMPGAQLSGFVAKDPLDAGCELEITATADRSPA